MADFTFDFQMALKKGSVFIEITKGEKSTVEGKQKDTMFELVQKAARRFPKQTAYEFMGRRTSFADWEQRVEHTACALYGMGIRPNECVTICMPNVPQAIDLFYALNRIGALSNIIHPLSAPKEVADCLRLSKSRAILVLDSLLPRIQSALEVLPADGKILVARVEEELPVLLRIGMTAVAWKKTKLPKDKRQIAWNTFLKKGKGVKLPRIQIDADQPAVILYSGGTTGTMKGILLSSRNFNALALQTIQASGYDSIAGMRMLAMMPIFHGFGLGVGIHTPLVGGASCILIPRFQLKSYARLLRTKKPNFIPGVPTLFEAMLRAEHMEKVDLSFVRGVFCGGDTLSPDLKMRVDAFLKKHHATEQIREGYGATECIAVSCLTPRGTYRRGSVGLPTAGTDYKIVRPGSEEEVPVGTEGEICISGPTVMLGYLDQPEETANTLRIHKDGKQWLHTGDLGKKDADGYIYFIQRIKRMIVTSGYNVYPTRVEAVLNSHPAVRVSCVIGVPDPYRMQRVRAYVQTEPEYKASDGLKEDLIALCRENMVQYAVPKEIVFRKIPYTKVNKVDYRALENEAAEEGKP